MLRSPKDRTIALEDRTFLFAKRVRDLVKRLPEEALPADDARKLLRSSTALDANCVDANEALCKEDYFMRIKMARNEAASSSQWLEKAAGSKAKKLKAEAGSLHMEAGELREIFETVVAEGDKHEWPPIEDIVHRAV